MEKREFTTIAEKNRVVTNIMNEVFKADTFLLLGHQDPDTDCIASLASCALLLRKLQKEAVIYLPGPVGEQFNYLLAICRYNGIAVRYGDDPVSAGIEALVILDTPKPAMIAVNGAGFALLENPAIRKIEIDHHLQADAAYGGDRDLSLVSEASSTCELIGYLCFKIAKQKGLAEQEFFPRNIALALLTGIVGDSHMGKYLKSHKERRFYQIFSAMFDKILLEQTHKDSTNLASMEAIFDAIQRFSVREKRCFDHILSLKREAAPLFFIALNAAGSAELFNQYEKELIVNVFKAAADTLAEEHGKLGLVSYYDPPGMSDFIQFRLRRGFRYKSLDLRKVLERLNISNGGGHPGAVGFRIRKSDIRDLEAYIQQLIDHIGAMEGSGETRPS